MARLACELEGLEVEKSCHVIDFLSISFKTLTLLIFIAFLWTLIGSLMLPMAVQVLVLRDPPVVQIFEHLSHVQSLATLHSYNLYSMRWSLQASYSFQDERTFRRTCDIKHSGQQKKFTVAGVFLSEGVQLN